MIKLPFILCVLSVLSVTPALAEDCPDFYRFVDFGVQDSDGVVYRGGPLLRAEDFDEDRLLLEEQTECLSVWPTLTDGRGNPIPVVARIFYDPAVTGTDVTELTVSSVEDTDAVANRTAGVHLAQLGSGSSRIVRGETFVCAAGQNTASISCQLVSPYSTTVPLIVRCDTSNCLMPVLPIDNRLMISAQWPSSDAFLSDPQAAGGDMFEMMNRIHRFLSPLSASF